MKKLIKKWQRSYIEWKYKQKFLANCDNFGDDRIMSFECFVQIQGEKNRELAKLN